MKNKKILKTLIKLQDEEISTLKRENESLQNIIRKRYSVNKKETIQDVANELDGKPTGLPESWCVDIRVDDPRVEGFKEWHDLKFKSFYSYNLPFYGDSNYKHGWDIYELHPQVITLDQFEEMSGVNLMDYVKVKPKGEKTKQEVKDMVDEISYYRGYDIDPPVHKSEVFAENEQPEKRYTKEEIIEQYGKFRMEKSFDSGFLDWIYEKM